MVILIIKSLNKFINSWPHAQEGTLNGFHSNDHTVGLHPQKPRESSHSTQTLQVEKAVY